eukprot:CAMPEP_0113481350 /NCGR_PEP_ID=MMETSP0014_2-20120614/22363_1 /TAXON_ID=2857 /ORGANISM="Nitzschia sp." /LENGTH=427 /DNA_ID=CAMNT_0000374843 /DNA_START=1009 /DNA_END=2292 /DNA_ORIENTATION=+ /assembly_acc=CAM_ASM_000159
MSDQQDNRKDDDQHHHETPQDKFLNPKMNMDEDVEEVTRRVGGGRGGPAPAMLAPSLGPMPTMPMGFGGGASTAPFATINTAPAKAMNAAAASTNTNIYVWKLTSAPTLPEFHPLEQTAVFVPNTTPTTVAARVSSVLRDRSIEAHYDDDKAKVKCLSSEGVDFRVRLYVGRGAQYSHGVIVEIQRRFGSSPVMFHADTQAILDAAMGRAPPPPPVLTSLNNLPEVSDDEDDENLNNRNSSSDELASLSQPSTDASLAMVGKMLQLQGFDSQHLGLHTLSSLVDPEKLSLSTARAVSLKLLRPDSEVGMKVFGYIIGRKGGKTSDDDESTSLLRTMSIGILANAMRSAAKVPEFLREPLRPVLLEDLKDADTHPGTAFLSAKCIEYFIRGDHDTTELNEAFEVARQAGEARHVNLMEQAQKCISAIR